MQKPIVLGLGCIELYLNNIMISDHFNDEDNLILLQWIYLLVFWSPTASPPVWEPGPQLSRKPPPRSWTESPGFGWGWTLTAGLAWRGSRLIRSVSPNLSTSLDQTSDCGLAWVCIRSWSGWWESSSPHTFLWNPDDLDQNKHNKCQIYDKNNTQLLQFNMGYI